MDLKFTIILKNNTSNKVDVFNNMMGDVSANNIIFKNVELELEDGEYTAYIFLNYRNDVEYIFKSNLMDSKIKVKNTIIPIKLLRPIIQILKIDNNQIETVFYNPQIENNEQINYKENYNILFYGE